MHILLIALLVLKAALVVGWLILRRRLKTKHVVDDPETALEQALDLARSTDALYLPGWCGPTLLP